MANKKNASYSFTKWLLWSWMGYFLILVIAALVMLVISQQNLPTFDDLENPDVELSTLVYAKNGEKLRRYFYENREQVSFQELNPYLKDALLATEDKRYYNHSGIDFKALGRVLVKTAILGNNTAGGGSTITQQLAKLLYTENLAGSKWERLPQKLREWITAVKLEKSYTKEEIISMYLNEFDFINNANGIQAAAETYFGKDQKDLNVQEAATLVGMLKNPAYFNPKRFPDRSRERRNVVLALMNQQGKLDDATFEEIKELPMDMSRFKRSAHDEGVGAYFGSELAKELKNILRNGQVRKADGTPYDIYRDGLRVYTSIDYNMQALAEEVMKEHMSNVQNRFFREWKGKDPWTYTDDEDKISVELRQAGLQRLMHESERYKNMLQSSYASQISGLEKDFDVTIRPLDLQRLLLASEQKGYITRLLSDKIISKDQATNYRNMLSDKNWKTIQSTWADFEQRVDKAFNTKRKMKVFTYETKSMEKDTTMSPMDSLKYHRMFLQTGILAIDPKTGYIKTWIGGIDKKHFKFDHIRAERQVGSTFKPFVYASAIFFKGISPCFKVNDVPYTISPGEGNFNLTQSWTPKNARAEYDRVPVPLYECLRQSKNSASVYLMKQLGDVKPVLDLISDMGIDTKERRYDGSYRVPRVPSLCLGAADLTVHEMTGAYATFANQGVYNKPQVILRIEDKNGKVIYRAIPEQKVVLDDKRAYIMVDMLRYATSSAGGFGGVKSEYGGKTGTTNDHTDGWFMGITPNLVVGTWVGGEDTWIRFRNFSNGQGSRMARPFFAEFIKRLEKTPGIEYNPNARFQEPEGDLGIEIDCQVYDSLQYKTVNPNTPDAPIQVDFEEDF